MSSTVELPITSGFLGVSRARNTRAMAVPTSIHSSTRRIIPSWSSTWRFFTRAKSVPAPMLMRYGRRSSLPNQDNALHQQKLDLAYRFREALRQLDWSEMIVATEEYRRIRTRLCSEYMAGARPIHSIARKHGGTAFPLGAGGGGATLVLVPDPAGLEALRKKFSSAKSEIALKVRKVGHERLNPETNPTLDK